MIAVDTNVWIHFLSGKNHSSIKILEDALLNRSVVMPIPVLHEILCFPELNDLQRAYFKELPLIPVENPMWLKASSMRSVLFRKRQKPKMIDSLIAQLCIDHDLSLLTIDQGFFSFQEFGLKLVAPVLR